MKATFFQRLAIANHFLSAFLLLACVLSTAAGEPAQPEISSVSVDSTNVVVTARVPAGLHRVTLECRERLGAGGWEPRRVTRLDGSGGTVTFRLPRARQLEVMRIRGDDSEMLPASFYAGTNVFAGEPANSSNPNDPTRLDIATPTTVPEGDSQRAVVESDIWRIRSQTLYFFNRLRGLQVIDLRNPSTPVVRGTLEMPAAGEDMYLLGEHHLVLLARNGCAYNESQVIIVVDQDGKPSVTASLPVTGYIQESRLVGTALYVASQIYRPVAGTTNSTWEWGTVVSSFDLANPAAPITRDTLWHAGYGNVVTATDRLLFVVTQDPTNWWRSIVRTIDITAPDGTMHAYESIHAAGRIPDKFKLDWNGSVLTTISEDWSQNNGRALVTRLETFRLPDPRSLGPVGVIKLGQVELGRGERLHATRFDGDRAYVVTFFQIDPLWVVDLSNPSSPRVAGSVDVPGWSTFIQPLGNRLVTVGIETNRVAVSLFDVANPAAPALLSRVSLGETYSWSEANWDEQAFNVLPDAGLILVPYSGNTTNGYAARMQLIDLNASSLAARGVIEHRMEPRRATVHGDAILSLSNSELLSVDAADRDHPVVRGRLALAWAVDRVFLQGQFLVEVAGSAWSWNGEGAPVLRVARADSPNDVLSELALTNLPVLGATAREGRLYVIQGLQSWYYPSVVPFASSTANTPAPPQPKLVLTVVGLEGLPALQILGQAEAEIEGLGWGGDLQAVWPRSDVLVWVGGGYSYWRWDMIGVAADTALMRPWFPYWGGNGGRLIAFEVGQPTAPQFASEVNLGTNNWWTFSKAFTAEGRVYLSHWTSEFMPDRVKSNSVPVDPTLPPGSPADPNQANVSPAGTWVTRSFLDVVDYADARHPLLRRPVNIPGTLEGISHAGEVLYTTRLDRTTNSIWGWVELLEASAYDGVAAHLIAALPLPESYPHPLLVVGTNIFIGSANYTNGPYGPIYWLGALDATVGGGAPAPGHALETWHLSNAGKFQRSGSVDLVQPASVLADFGALLAAQENDGAVVLFDAMNGAMLRQTGRSQPAGCLWFDLNRADGALGRGLWIPLGVYGVAKVPAEP